MPWGWWGPKVRTIGWAAVQERSADRRMKMGGKPSKGTRKDKRLKGNRKGKR